MSSIDRSTRLGRACGWRSIAILGCLLWTTAAAAADAPTPLGTRLAKVLDSRALRGATVGALVVRDSDGALLYEHQPDRGLIPASNQKLLTSLAALEVFGPTFRFETVVSAARSIGVQGEIGDLIVRGGGDPVLNSEDWWRLALELHNRGLRRVTGDIVIDDSAFDAARWHPNWGRTSARAYHAPIGALTANYGAFEVVVAPASTAGARPRVDVNPPIDYLALSNQATTIAKGSTSLVVDRKANGTHETVVVGGKVRAGREPQSFYRSVLDPGLYAGNVLSWQLAAVGIAVDGKVRRGREPEASVELLRFEGRAMSEIVRLFVKHSNNSVAESLIKAMGATQNGGVGSWKSGVKVMREALTLQGIDLSHVTSVDGSGLSRDNRVSARALVDVLRTGRRSFRFGPEFVGAMPIAALDGTLAKRTAAASGEVRAKTGLLDGVTALSGFAQMRDGELAAFSILVNGYKVGDRDAMDALDVFAAELVGAR